MIAAPWIVRDAISLMTPDCVATKAISSENSLICPSRNPASQASLFLSLNLRNKNRNTIGLMVNTRAASTMAGQIISENSEILNWAPREKKNKIRKKSLSGFNLSAI